MFGWLRNWWNKDREGVSKTDNPMSVFDARTQEVFTYWNGTEWITEDPMILFKKIMAVATDLSIDISVSNSVSERAPKAHDNVIHKIREIFKIKPFMEGGLTETNTAKLLDQFLLYVGFEKKSTNPMPTSATGTSPTTDSTSEGSPPAENISDSGSTDAGPSTDNPPSSPTEPESPSDPSNPPTNTSEP